MRPEHGSHASELVYLLTRRRSISQPGKVKEVGRALGIQQSTSLSLAVPLGTELEKSQGVGHFVCHTWD